MKFNKIKISEEITKVKGVSGINIRSLSNVVAFVGRNGSGKTRILDLIENELFNTIKVEAFLDETILHAPTYLETYVANLIQFKDYFISNAEIQDLQKLAAKQPQNLEVGNQLRLALANQSRALHPAITNQPIVNNSYSECYKSIPFLKQKYFRRIKNSEVQKLQQYVSANKEEGALLFENLVEQNTSINLNGADEFKFINKSSLRYLAKLPNKLAFDFNDTFGDAVKYEARVSHKRYLSLKKFIYDFLKKDLTWEKRRAKHIETEEGVQSNYSGIWKLDNRDFNYEEFSDGEKTLFTYALLFFLLEQNTKLDIKESIILIDEPELHLHPDSEIDLINGIRNTIGEKGQLIIATHSINILSTLNYEEIFMVKNGVIKHPTQATPGESLSELMGIQERVNKLSDFLSSVSIWAHVNFMSQCFNNPDVIQSSRRNDPQIEIFKKTIKQNFSKEKNMLLDFGAGKGRLYKQIKDDFEFIDKINYSALEPESEFHSTLNELGAKQIFKSYTELSENAFDFIVLCNVLHEIPLDSWEENLNKIIKALKENGHLIIIEVKELSRGEKIGEIGYLLLDIDEIQKLFKLSTLSSIKNADGKDNITCAVINKSQLSEVNKSDILNCVAALETNTLKKIEAIRKTNYSAKEAYGVGRKSAFFSQQYINARFAREHIEKKR